MMYRKAHPAMVVGAVAMAFVSGSPLAEDEEEDHDSPYRMEAIEGSDLMRIDLAGTAMDRLGIETAAVSLTKADRVFVVGGRIVLDTGESAEVAAASPGPSADPAWVSFPITEEIEDSLGLSVLIRPLDGGGAGSGIPAIADTDLNDGITAEAGGWVSYKLQGDASGLAADEVVLVEVPYSGNGVDHTTVPYAAIIYDEEGDEWVYVSPEPGVFQRFEVEVAYVAGDLALLLKGPDVGAQVVTVGASELLGIEYKVGH